MRLARKEPHPEKEGWLHVFECIHCKMPLVVYSPSSAVHVSYRGYELYAVPQISDWSAYVYPMARGIPELTAEQQLIEHPAQDDAVALARNRIDGILGTRDASHGYPFNEKDELDRLKARTARALEADENDGYSSSGAER